LTIATNGIPKGLAATGDFVITISSNQTINVTKKGTAVSSTKVDWAPSAIGVSPSGTQVAIGDEDRKVHLYSFDAAGALKEEKVLEHNRGMITVLSYSPDGKLLASADKERMILVFDTSSWTIKINQWMFHNARINSLSWSPDGKHAVSGSLDTNVEVWSVDNPTKHVAIKNAHLESVNCVAFLDNNTVLSAGQDGSIKSWAITYN
ncbi:hypothetical protein HK101_001448, partial [Irineochytrium annulatum]